MTTNFALASFLRFIVYEAVKIAVSTQVTVLTSLHELAKTKLFQFEQLNSCANFLNVDGRLVS